MGYSQLKMPSVQLYDSSTNKQIAQDDIAAIFNAKKPPLLSTIIEGLTTVRDYLSIPMSANKETINTLDKEWVAAVGTAGSPLNSRLNTVRDILIHIHS